MFRFASPESFFWLWFLPLRAFALFYFVRQDKSVLQKALGPRMHPFLTSSLSMPKRRLKWILEGLVLVFAIFALARPQLGAGSESIKSEGIELIIAFDVSSSMLAEDVKPSRLEFAKREVFRLIDTMTGSKVGVVAFAGSAALSAPMTTDRSALKMFVDSLSPSSVGSQGTEFRRALLEAESAFERGSDVDDGSEEEEETSSEEPLPVTRAILIVSDGEDNEPGALAAAESLAKKGIHIFSLAFGTEKGAPIPVRASNGTVRGYKRDANGKTILSSTKGTVLKKLAEVGKGSFYFATFGGNAIPRIANDINQLEKTKFEDEVITTYSEKYQILLLVALLLALLEIFLGERFTGREVWKGRFEIPYR